VGARTGTGLVGFSATPTFTNPNGNNYDPAFYWDNGVPPYQQPPFFSATYGTQFDGISNVGATMQYGDPHLGGIPPRYQNWNVSLDHAFTSTLSLGLAYIGSHGHYLGEATNGGGRGIWSDQIDPRYLVLGNLLNAQATPANVAAAAPIVPGIGLPYPNFTGSISQMLRPFPQHPDISDLWGDIGNSHYNSVQVTAIKTTSHGLTFNFNYTFARAMDDASGIRSAYNWITERARTQIPDHVLNLPFVYDLPFGKGKAFGSRSKLVTAVAGGWQLSGITTLRSRHSHRHHRRGLQSAQRRKLLRRLRAWLLRSVRINGGWGSGNVLGLNATTYLDVHAFASPAPYTHGTASRMAVFGVTLPGSHSQDLSLRRTVPITEKVHLVFEADAINVFNFVNFGTPNLTITSSGFGKITSQANSPRVLQLGARVAF
jgi:hypothetical protein